MGPGANHGLGFLNNVFMVFVGLVLVVFAVVVAVVVVCWGAEEVVVFVVATAVLLAYLPASAQEQ